MRTTLRPQPYFPDRDQPAEERFWLKRYVEQLRIEEKFRKVGCGVRETINVRRS